MANLLVILFMTNMLIVGVFTDAVEVQYTSPDQTNDEHKEVKIWNTEKDLNPKAQHEDIDEEFTDSEYIPVEDNKIGNNTDGLYSKFNSTKLTMTSSSDEVSNPTITIRTKVNSPKMITDAKENHSSIPLEVFSTSTDRTSSSTKLIEENISYAITETKTISKELKSISEKDAKNTPPIFDEANSTSVSSDKYAPSTKQDNSTPETSNDNINSTLDEVNTTMIPSNVTTKISSEVSISTSTEVSVFSVKNLNSSESSISTSNYVSASKTTDLISLNLTSNESLTSNSSDGTTSEDMMISEVAFDFDSSSTASEPSDTVSELISGKTSTSNYSDATIEVSQGSSSVPTEWTSSLIEDTSIDSSGVPKYTVTEITSSSESSKDSPSPENPTIKTEYFISTSEAFTKYFLTTVSDDERYSSGGGLSTIIEETSTSSSTSEDVKSSTSEVSVEQMHVVTIPSLRKVKIALALVFLGVALIALIALVIFLIKMRKPSIDYEELSLMP